MVLCCTIVTIITHNAITWSCFKKKKRIRPCLTEHENLNQTAWHAWKLKHSEQVYSFYGAFRVIYRIQFPLTNYRVVTASAFCLLNGFFAYPVRNVDVRSSFCTRVRLSIRFDLFQYRRSVYIYKYIFIFEYKEVKFMS